MRSCGPRKGSFFHERGVSSKGVMSRRVPVPDRVASEGGARVFAAGSHGGQIWYHFERLNFKPCVIPCGAQTLAARQMVLESTPV